PMPTKVFEAEPPGDDLTPAPAPSSAARMAGASTRVMPPFSAPRRARNSSFSSNNKSMRAAPTPTVTGPCDMFETPAATATTILATGCARLAWWRRKFSSAKPWHGAYITRNPNQPARRDPFRDRDDDPVRKRFQHDRM